MENQKTKDQEKRFLEWVKARDDDWWEDEARISIWDFRIMQEFFKEDITNALNQQRVMFKKIMLKDFEIDHSKGSASKRVERILTKLEK